MKQLTLRLFLAASLILIGITGTAAAAADSVPAVNLTTSQWVGHNFVFLSLPADKQAEGYGIFAADQAVRGFQEDRSVRLPYLQHVGRLVAVTDVTAYTAGDGNFDYVISMTEIDTGQKLVGRTFRGSLEGLALAEDIENARRQFLGKTIYPKKRSLNVASAQSGGSVTIKIGAAVTVTDVYAGMQSREPVWLIVSVNGQKAILPIAYTWTNQTVNTWTQNPPWQSALFMDDPRVSLGWSAALWDNIDSGSVLEGMTQEQVRLSWGPPQRVDEGASGPVWYYGTQVLKFTGDTLTSIEATGGIAP